MLPSQPNQSLIDGIACLQALTSHGDPIGVRALGRELGMEPTRANRLIKTLAHLGLAQQTAERKYVVGPAIHVLSAQVLHASGLIRRAIGPLENLHRHGLVVAMGVLWRTNVCYIYHRSASKTAAEALGSTHYNAATQSGIGLALLAELADTRIGDLYRRDEPADFADPPALLAELDRIRRDGYAVKRFNPHLTTVAVGVGAPAYAAIGLSGEIARADMDDLVEMLRSAAAEIEHP